MASSEELLFILKLQDAMSSALKPVVDQLNSLGVSAAGAKTSLDSIASNTSLTATAASAEAAASSMSNFRNAITSAAAAFVALKAGDAVLKSTLGTFGQYEQIMLSVEKYSSMNEADMQKFSQGFDKLASSMPLPIEELGKMAALSASLGIQGPENINNFTSAVAKLSVASNLSGESLVKSIAQIQNIFQEPANDALKLVSVIERVDNATQATGRDVVQMAVRVSQGGAAFNMGSTEAVALGAALAGLGVRSERAGSAVLRTYTSLREAVSGELKGALSDLESLTGMTEQQLKALETASPNAMFDLFIKKLGELINSGHQYDGLLKTLQLSQVQTGSSIVTLAKNYQSLADKEVIAFNALTESIPRADQEFTVFSQGLQQHLQLLTNNWQLFGKDIGQAVAPQAKVGIDVLTSALQGMKTIFDSLSPSTKVFVADIVAFGGSAAGAVTAAGLLVNAFRLIGPLMISMPWVAAAAGVGVLVAGVLDLTGAFNSQVEISQESADLIQKVGGNSTEAASAISQMTESTRTFLELQTTAKLDELNAKLEQLKTQAQSDFAGQTFWQRIVTGLAQADGVVDDSQTKLNQLLRMYTEGVAGVDYFTQHVADLAKSDPTIEAQALKVLNMGQQWAAANNQVQQYELALSRLQNTNIPNQSDNGQQIYNSASQVGPQPATGGKDYLAGQGGGSSHAQQVKDFVTDTQAKIQAMTAETAAMGKSVAAYDDVTRAEKLEADTRAVAKRAADLKLDAAATQQLVQAYQQADTAYAKAQQQQNITQETQQINDKIAAMAKEETALKAGTQAYNAYKAASTIDTDAQQYASRLENLGMEETAVQKLVQAYKDQATALANAQVQYEKNSQTEKDVTQLTTGLADAVGQAADAWMFQGKTATQAATDFATAVSEMVVKAVLLKPLETELTSLFNGALGIGASGSGGGLSTMGGGLFGMLGNLFGGGSGMATGSELAGLTTDAAGIASGGVGGVASILHAGGIVGANDNTLRSVDMRMFANAPRYHDGLGNDEVAAILQRGERVITGSQNQQLQSLLTQVGGNSGGVAQSQPNIVFNITTPNSDSFQASQSQIYAKAGAALSRTAQRNGGSR